jgi:hypothetical protein
MFCLWLPLLDKIARNCVSSDLKTISRVLWEKIRFEWHRTTKLSQKSKYFHFISNDNSKRHGSTSSRVKISCTLNMWLFNIFTILLSFNTICNFPFFIILYFVSILTLNIISLFFSLWFGNLDELRKLKLPFFENLDEIKRNGSAFNRQHSRSQL